MAITALSTDWGTYPRIIRVTTTDSLSTVLTAGYITAQAANIKALQNGAFQWTPEDLVLIAGVIPGAPPVLLFESFFNVNPTFTSFIPATVSNSFLTQVLVTSAQIQTMDATPVPILPLAPSGYIYLLNSIQGTYLYGGTQYTAGGAIGLEWADTAALAGPAASSTLAGATFDGYTANNTFVLTPNNTNTLANIEGMGVWLSNNTAPFATGNGTLLMNVGYQLIAV
jgi:hypothetical protein